MSTFPSRNAVLPVNLPSGSTSNSVSSASPPAIVPLKNIGLGNPLQPSQVVETNPERAYDNEDAINSTPTGSGQGTSSTASMSTSTSGVGGTHGKQGGSEKPKPPKKPKRKSATQAVGRKNAKKHKASATSSTPSDCTDEGTQVSSPLSSASSRPAHDDPAKSISTTLSTPGHQKQTNDVAFKVAPLDWLLSVPFEDGNSAVYGSPQLPIDVEALYSHGYNYSPAAHFSVSNRVVQSEERVYACSLTERSGTSFFVHYHHVEDRQMMFCVEAHTNSGLQWRHGYLFLLKESRSMFFDWLNRFDDKLKPAAVQDAQRWRVLVFVRPKGELNEDTDDFKTAVERNVDSYGNRIVIHGAVEHWQMAPSGAGVAITVDVGEIYLVVTDPGDQAPFFTSAFLKEPKSFGVPLGSRCEALVLKAGNRVVIPPCTLYMAYTIKDAVCHKRYFYSTPHLQMTQVALAHQLILGELASRDPATLDITLPILCRLMVFFHDFILPGKVASTNTDVDEGDEDEDEDRKRPPSETAYHLPILLAFDIDFNSVIDLFSLINIILLMPVYDLRMYLSRQDGRRAHDTMPPEDKMLLLLAQKMALTVGDWYFKKYVLKSPSLKRYVDGKREFWVVSLLHHANALIQYKLVADRQNKGRTTEFSVTELRGQLRLCLEPFLKEIEVHMIQNKLKYDDSLLFMPEEKLLHLASTIDPRMSAPLVIYSTMPDLQYPTLEPRLREQVFQDSD
ncbi:hypothetical protein NMY22_g19350 [Coprinellus aureogranulatus]|nr:hypothetical protein NMY22_g19350 [Coprinellus aureogranulatus]